MFLLNITYKFMCYHSFGCTLDIFSRFEVIFHCGIKWYHSCRKDEILLRPNSMWFLNVYMSGFLVICYYGGAS